MNPVFRIGDKVRDLDGFEGFIMAEVTSHGSTWFEVRFSSGLGVRYPHELTPL